MDYLLRILPGPQPIFVRYGLTILLVLVTFGLKLGLEGRTGLYGFILFVPAIVAAALIFDRGSGYVAIATTVACVATRLTWTGETSEPHVSALVSFVIVGTGLVFVSEGLRRALEKAEEAARQRDFLLQEMNHRVKNKFAMIHSIIGLQARAAPPEARESLDAIAGRVKVMASVHDYLQLARHDGEMDMAEYLNRLCTSLSEALGALRPIAMMVDVDPIRLPPSKALSAGLIVNELVTNVYKYAFPLERSGRIDVSLKLTSGVLRLCIKDDGVGSAADARKGLGTTLVNVLAGQLGGSVNREALSPGWLVTVTFEP